MGRARYGPVAEYCVMARPDETTPFGSRDVALEDKQTLVNAVFHNVAQRYDLMNDLMSGGSGARARQNSILRSASTSSKAMRKNSHSPTAVLTATPSPSASAMCRERIARSPKRFGC